MATEKPNFVELVPELAEWNEGRGIDIDAWICCVGDFTHAIGYGRLFWPQFVEHDGAVFFAHGFSEESYRGFLSQTSGDRRAVEAVMKHQHLARLFGDRSLTPSRGQLIHLGELLSDIWSTKLQRDFPSRRFSVDVLGADAPNLEDLEITFRQTDGAG